MGELFIIGVYHLAIIERSFLFESVGAGLRLMQISLPFSLTPILDEFRFFFTSVYQFGISSQLWSILFALIL